MKYTEQELIDELHRVSEEHCDEKVPRTEDIRKYSDISRGAFYSHYDVWKDALKAAGFDNSRSEIPKQKLIEEIKSVSNNYCNKEPPTIEDINKYASFSIGPYYKFWDNWNEALDSAGFKKYNRKSKYNKEELLDEIGKLSQKHLGGDTPTQSDMRNYGISTTIYENNFGSWNNALEKAGFDTWNPSGENNPNWQGGLNRYYGENWRSQKIKALERDSERCRVCNGTNEHLDRAVSVHHITPWRYWDVEKEKEEMNSLSNLICLCISCHQKLEGKFKGRTHEQFEKEAKQYIF